MIRSRSPARSRDLPTPCSTAHPLSLSLSLSQVLYQKAAENSKLVQAAKVVAAAREKVFGGFGKKK
jgi:hypothetical protein